MTAKRSAVLARRSAVLTVSALVLGAALTGCSGLSFGRPEHKAVDDAKATGPVSAVEVGTSSGDVHIRPGPGDGVTIHRTVHYHGDRKPTPGQKVENGRLTFSDGCDSCTIDYELTVPAGVTVKVSTSSGDVNVQGVASADLKTHSGDMAVSGIAGALTTEASSGDLTAIGLSGSDVSAKASSGNIRLTFVKPPQKVTTRASSGDVTVQVPGGPYATDVHTSSGDRRVTVPTDPSATARIQADTSSGDVTVSHAGA
ncbi:DUF4097 family beta strand repeat-containing protein [Streptomyces sp. H10-C2]|uniref:DUF4097 family beta strand repeat-containing protein n=1 Tax=Streptomyces sp. H10-C2 TaxID=3046210 RepID=UPI0024B958DB|nr:DUF4097 family beta strand repeat-containing protein [Streptomyces sp. H10-C2]MDJ0368375.1 DUF4097 family beta strand repeat-containing protein [Streptomyces sp. H10-C2]